MAKRKFVCPTQFADCVNNSDTFPVVQEGLALTPSDVKQLTDKGIAVSAQQQNVSNASDLENGFYVDPMYRRGTDLNDLWNIEKSTRAKFNNSYKRDKKIYG